MSSGISKLFGGGSKSGSGSKSGGSKSKLSSKLKKAAIIGVGAYGAYQVGKLAAKAATWPFRNAFSFNDWNSWREVDGMLCRNTNDCTWIDRQLYCQDYELDFSPSVSLIPCHKMLFFLSKCNFRLLGLEEMSLASLANARARKA